MAIEEGVAATFDCIRVLPAGTLRNLGHKRRYTRAIKSKHDRKFMLVRKFGMRKKNVAIFSGKFLSSGGAKAKSV